MRDKNFINIFKKSSKWIALFLFGGFLFILALNRLGVGFRNKTISDYGVKNKKTFSLVLKPEKKSSKNNLKDIFNIPDKKYKKFNRLFISKGLARGGADGSLGSGRPGGENLPNFIKRLKFKGFSKKNPAPPSLIFISGKTALLEIGGISYYIRVGESIKGMFILKIGLTGVRYSDKGKIKYLNF